MSDLSSTPVARRAGKAPGAFRTISEVADVLDVPQHVLRFWESKFTQVKPMKRGGGRRYYRPEDVDILRGIRHLLYTDGYTIKGVQKLFRDNGVKAVMETVVVNAASSAAEAAGVQVLKNIDGGGDNAASGPLMAAQKKQISAVVKELSALKTLLRRIGA